MNTFERAKELQQKRAAKHAEWKARSLEKKEEVVQVPFEVRKEPVPQISSVMKVSVDGPFKFDFEIHYGGTLMSSQINEAYLRGLFKKQLSAIGKVL